MAPRSRPATRIQLTRPPDGFVSRRSAFCRWTDRGPWPRVPSPRAYRRYRAPPPDPAWRVRRDRTGSGQRTVGPGSSRATGIASPPPGRSWPASPTPRGPAAWRGRSTVSRLACATAQRASTACGFASPPSAGNVLGAALHRGVSWQGKEPRPERSREPKAVSQRRQFTGPSLNRLGLRCARFARWPPRAWEMGRRGNRVGHRFARLTPGSRGVVNRRRYLTDTQASQE
jgi:hypothetical protein